MNHYHYLIFITIVLLLMNAMLSIIIYYYNFRKFIHILLSPLLPSSSFSSSSLSSCCSFRNKKLSLFFPPPQPLSTLCPLNLSFSLFPLLSFLLTLRFPPSSSFPFPSLPLPFLTSSLISIPLYLVVFASLDTLKIIIRYRVSFFYLKLTV